MIDIYIVHDNPNVEDLVWNIPTEINPFIHFLDIGSKKDKHKAFKFKQDWGARKTPFCLIESDGVPLKAFYSETGDSAINQLIEFLRTYERN